MKAAKWGGARDGAGRPKGEPTTVVRLPLPVAAIARRIADHSLMPGNVRDFLDVEARTHRAVPLMTSPASCGFPSPADDYMDGPLDFNELLIVNPPATFVVRAAGDSMTGAGIYEGDFVVVDRSLTARDGLIVLGLLGNEFTLKRYRCKGDRCWLQPENPAYADIHLTEDTPFEIWGVVKKSIRNH